MIYYKLVKVMINALGQTKVIIDLVVYYHGILESIVIDPGLLFTAKF